MRSYLTKNLRYIKMGILKIEGVTHWSIPVNDLAESEGFYGDLLGLTPLGRLGNSVMSCLLLPGNSGPGSKRAERCMLPMAVGLPLTRHV